MKYPAKIFFLLLLGSSLILTSCGDRDKDNNDDDNSGNGGNGNTVLKPEVESFKTPGKTAIRGESVSFSITASSQLEPLTKLKISVFQMNSGASSYFSVPDFDFDTSFTAGQKKATVKWSLQIDSNRISSYDSLKFKFKVTNNKNKTVSRTHRMIAGTKFRYIIRGPQFQPKPIATPPWKVFHTARQQGIAFTLYPPNFGLRDAGSNPKFKDIEDGSIANDDLAHIWTIQTESKMLKAPGNFDYENATDASARDVYQSGNPDNILQDIQTDDILIFKVVRKGKDYESFMILKVVDMLDEGQKDKQYTAFHVKMMQEPY